MRRGGSGKQIGAGALALVAMAASGGWIYYRQAGPRDVNVPLQAAVGQVMAEETGRLLGGKGAVVVMAIDPSVAPELRVQLDSFRQALKVFGVGIRDTIWLEAKNKPRYGAGRGLGAGRLLEVIQSAGERVDAVVSFVGAPRFAEADFKEWKKAPRPKFIAESGSATRLKPLFDQGVLQAAVVRRFQFPAPRAGPPATAREWFEKRFQVVTLENAATLPGD